MRRFPPTAVVVLLIALAPAAEAQTWSGTFSTDWNTAANWSPNTIPNSAAAGVLFANSGVGSVNISSSVQAQTLTFENSSGSFTLTSSSNQTLSGVTNISVGPIVATTDTINLANVANGGLLFPANDSLTITNDAALGSSPTLVIGPNTVISAGNAVGGVIVTGTGYTTISGTVGGAPTIAGGLTKSGTGTLVLSGNNSNLLGGIDVTGGTLAVPGSNALGANGGGVTLNGGTLEATGSFSSSRAVAVNSGGGTISVDSGRALTLSGALSGSGTLTATGPGSLSLNGGGSVGAIAVTGGSATAGGGTLNITSNTFSLNVGTATSAPTFTVNNGAVVNVTATGPAGVQIDGAAGSSVVVTGAGSKLNVTSYILAGLNNTGNLTVQNGGSVVISSGGTLELGANGGSSGTALVQSGGSLSTPLIYAGNFGGAPGTVTVTGAGSTATVTDLELGFVDGSGNSSPGQLIVSNGGAVTVTTINFNTAVSSVTVNGGTLTVNALGAAAGVTPAIAISDPSAGPALTVNTNNTAYAFNGTIADAAGGPGTVNKVGNGTLTMTGHLTNTGGYTATTGTIDFSGAVVQPGTGSLTAAAGATIEYDTGARVFGGFLHGPGTQIVTGGSLLSGSSSNNSAVISITGAATLTNFSNGGTLSVAGGLTSIPSLTSFINQGSGTITVGAGSAINASDFQTYGMLTVTPNTTAKPTILTNTGTAPLYFNGGSRTLIGTPATADPTGQNIVDYLDLHGNNAIVAGGLFVNNGGIYDTVGAGTGTIIADYGSLVKGAGFYQNTARTQNGGKFQTGNSPGSATFGNFVFGPGGVSNYIFAIDDATGTAGPSPNAVGLVSGWGLIKAVQVSLGTGTTPGSFTWTATPTNPLTVAIDTLVNPTTVGTDVAGPMADFDPSQSYSWIAAHWTGTYAGPSDAATLDADTSFDTSRIANPIAGTFGWDLDTAEQTLSLVYTPSSVPEPGTLAMVGLAAAGLAGWRRRGQPTGPRA